MSNTSFCVIYDKQGANQGQFLAAPSAADPTLFKLFTQAGGYEASVSLSANQVKKPITALQAWLGELADNEATK